jgi:hypothetical protein
MNATLSAGVSLAVMELGMSSTLSTTVTNAIEVECSATAGPNTTLTVTEDVYVGYITYRRKWWEKWKNKRTKHHFRYTAPHVHYDAKPTR